MLCWWRCRIRIGGCIGRQRRRRHCVDTISHADQDFEDQSEKGGVGTYKKPYAKTKVTATFSILLKDILNTCVIGKNKIAKSVKTVDTALAIHRPTRLIQRPGTFVFHNFWMGLQVKMKRQVLMALHKITNAPMPTAYTLADRDRLKIR